jgi:hypothetical protein
MQPQPPHGHTAATASASAASASAAALLQHQLAVLENQRLRELIALEIARERGRIRDLELEHYDYIRANVLRQPMLPRQHQQQHQQQHPEGGHRPALARGAAPPVKLRRQPAARRPVVPWDSTPTVDAPPVRK